MPRSFRRHSAEIPVRSPGLRLLPAMLIGVGIAGAVAWFAIGLRPEPPAAVPGFELRVEGDGLVLPDGTRCAVARHGCDRALAALPVARIRVDAPPEALFALAAPALALAARHHLEGTLDAGTGPVPV